MKKIYYTQLILFFSISFLASACVDEGPGGTSEIHFIVKHHIIEIPYARVFIKYGATESAGTDTTLYDDVAQSDETGHGHFTNLEKGSYYLYGVGFDSAIVASVTGGIPIKLKANSELVTDVPVTE